VFTIVVLMLSHFFSGNDFTNAIIIGFISCLAVVLNYVFFYKSGRLDASAILFSLTFFVACVITIVLTGGYDSPVRIMLICTPVVAFLVGGRQEGMYNASLSFVAGIVLLVLKVFDFDMMQIMPAAVLPYLSGIIWLLTLVLIVVCLFVYDVLLEDTRNTIVRAEQNNEKIEDKTPA